MTACAFHRQSCNMNMCASVRIRPVIDAAQLAVSICARLIGMILRLRAFFA